jgi:hypothetical protein
MSFIMDATFVEAATRRMGSGSCATGSNPIRLIRNLGQVTKGVVRCQNASFIFRALVPRPN